jgi:hypothetical protein
VGIFVTDQNNKYKKLTIKSNKINSKIAFIFIGWLFILANSISIIFFASQRGNPPILKVLYWMAFAVILTQIAIYTTKIVFNMRGNFNSIFDVLMKYVAIVWLIVIFAQLVFSNSEFDVTFRGAIFRWDYIIIFIAQVISAFLVLILMNKVQAFSNQYFKDKSKDLSSNKILEKREFFKNSLYFSIIALLFGIQSGILAIPNIPPYFDQIFSENRVLKFEYDKEDNGYWVTDVYSGINDSIVIPLEFNKIKVIGIKEGAINNSNASSIKSITLGKMVNGELESNLLYIESNGIVLNSILKISIPSSIERLGQVAISGELITEIDYHSISNFSMNVFDTRNLIKLNLLNINTRVDINYSEFAHLESTDYQVFVPSDLYNNYRENAKENKTLFKPILNPGEFVVDFETNTEVYINSIIKSFSNTQINLSEFGNNSNSTSDIISDTDIYNNDQLSKDGFISKPGYVFRGCYLDPSFILEIKFSSSEGVSFTGNTTVYAKWEKLNTLTLDWNNFIPEMNFKSSVEYVFTDDRNESVDLPRLIIEGGDIERSGYEKLSWYFNDVKLSSTLDLYKAGLDQDGLQLRAVWELKRPDLEFNTVVNNRSESGNNLNFVFDENQSLIFKADMSHESKEVTLKYTWTKITGNVEMLLVETTTSNVEVFNFNLRDVKDSGAYRLDILATSRTGEQSSISQMYTINIQRKNLDISSFQVPQLTVFTYNGFSQTLTYPFFLPNDIQATST